MTNGREDTVRLSLPSHPRYLPLVRALAGEGARAAGFDEEARTQVSLGVTEAVTNVMRHGYGGDTRRRIDLELQAPEGVFRLEIRDYGRYVEPAEIRSRPLEHVRPGGLGVHLIHATMDVVEYVKNEHGGTTLKLEKRLDPEPGAEDGS